MLLIHRRARTHVFADALHHGTTAALIHNLGPRRRVAPPPPHPPPSIVAPTPATQTAPGADGAVAAPSHHVRVWHAAE